MKNKKLGGDASFLFAIFVVWMWWVGIAFFIGKGIDWHTTRILIVNMILTVLFLKYADMTHTRD